MKTLVLITNIPNPYRIPLFNELHDQLMAEGIELLLVFAAETYSRRKFVINMSDCKFKYHILHSDAIQGRDPEKTAFSYKGLYPLLKIIKPWRIIVSGFSAASMQVWLYSKLYRCRYLIWSGSIARPGYKESILRRWQRKLLINDASNFVVYGTAAREYLKSRGVSDSNIFTAINTVDTEFFRLESLRIRSTLQKQDEVLKLLYIGYLVPRKNVKRLIELADELKKGGLTFLLTLVGDGSEINILKNLCARYNLNENVRFEGFRQKEELPDYLAGADIFLFQTDFDIWGLSLNEAMAAGLCCLASENAGATRDLIQKARTGYPANFTKVKEVAALIEELNKNREKLTSISKASAEFIRKEVNLKLSAEGFIKALK